VVFIFKMPVSSNRFVKFLVPFYYRNFFSQLNKLLFLFYFCLKVVVENHEKRFSHLYIFIFIDDNDDDDDI